MQPVTHKASVPTSAFQVLFRPLPETSHRNGPFVLHPPMLFGSTDGSTVTGMLIEFNLLLMRLKVTFGAFNRCTRHNCTAADEEMIAVNVTIQRLVGSLCKHQMETLQVAMKKSYFWKMPLKSVCNVIWLNN